MKNILTIAILLCTSISLAQVAIGKTTVDAGAILDFGTEARTLLMSPSADVTSMNPTAGTIAFDAGTGSFRYYNGTWSTAISGGIIGGAFSEADRGTQGVIIGDATTTVEGVLILEAADKALILPKIANGQFSIAAPKAGMVFYDTALKGVMVYNGNTWTLF